MSCHVRKSEHDVGYINKTFLKTREDQRNKYDVGMTHGTMRNDTEYGMPDNDLDVCRRRRRTKMADATDQNNRSRCDSTVDFISV